MFRILKTFPKLISSGMVIGAITVYALIGPAASVRAEGPPPCDCLYADQCYSNGAQVGSQCCWNAVWGGC